ncbi:MAG TPA: hypothetical protein VMI54_12315 [Polyangiaceae bacterium]|nr:hypothetical protein [Polyangiaceae bacterium]
MLALFVTHLLVSCASSSDHFEPAGVPNPVAGAATAAGGAGGAGGAQREPLAGRASDDGGATAGAKPAGAGQGGRAETNQGGSGGTNSSVGGAGPMPGFSCDGTATCQKGEWCVDCNQGEITVGLCAPNPQADPPGYKAATASCLTLGAQYSDCDGPEDCDADEYCVLAGDHAGGVCQTTPAPDPATCCFTCDAPPVCTLCWLDSDCPFGFTCTPEPDAPNDVGGCIAAQ